MFVQMVFVIGVVLVIILQEVVLVDVVKVMNMFFLFNINILVLGVVENMLWFILVELFDNKYYIFGQGGGEVLVKVSKFIVFGQVLLVQGICEVGDGGWFVVLDENNKVSCEVFMMVVQNVVCQVVVCNEIMDFIQMVNVQF